MSRFLLVVCVLSVIAGTSLLVLQHGSPNAEPAAQIGEPTVVATSSLGTQSGGAESSSGSSLLRIGSSSVRVVLADTPAKRTQGLSGTDGLAEGDGMLFIFPEDGLYGFWMKDMRFAIDIIWLDSAWEVVDVAESVSPDSYPASFSPSKPARYVLEVSAGFAKSHNIAVGSEAVFLR